MRTIEISHKTIIFTIAFLVGLWLLWQIKAIILALFIAFILATALDPPVNWLTKLKIPRTLAILCVYIVVLGILFSASAAIIPPLVDQTTVLAARLPEYLARLGIAGVVDPEILSQQLANLGRLPANVLQFVLSLFSNIIAVFITLVLTFYILLEWGKLDKRLAFLFGQDGDQAKLFLTNIEKKLGGWIRGELILMTIIGVFTYIGLRLLGIHFALPLAILAGLLEVVPNIGPLVSAVPAVIVGFTISPVMGLSVAALYFLIQQIENSVVMPKVMERSVGLPPLATLIALGIGVELGGIMGAILAVPALLVIQVTVSQFFKEWKLG